MTKPIVVKKSSSTKHKISNGGSGTGAHMKILNTVATLKVTLGKESIERNQLSFYTRINGKSTIANALTKLKNKQWLEVTPQEVRITEEGMEQATVDASDVQVPTCNMDYHDTIKEQHKLKPNAIKLFDAIVDGKTYNKKEIATSIGMKLNSTFANMLTEGKKMKIWEYDNKTIRLTDEMFPMEPRVQN